MTPSKGWFRQPHRVSSAWSHLIFSAPPSRLTSLRADWLVPRRTAPDSTDSLIDTIELAVINTALSVELVMNNLNWQVEQERFMRVAYPRTLKAAQHAFSGWHVSKQDDSIASCIGKMWNQWSRLLLRGRDPEPMIAGLIRQ